MSNFAKLSEEFSKAKQYLMSKGKSMIENEFKAIFERHPEINAVKWTQYTPYFNDGEECIFGVHDFSVANVTDPDRLSAWGEIDDEQEGEFVVGWNELKEKYGDIRELESFASSDFGEDIFKDTFGNHVVVTVTREGIDVSDYDHD